MGSAARDIGGVAALLGAAYAVAYRQGRTYGATCAELQRPLPGDDLVPEPNVSATHAVTIPAPPAGVWPLLVQVGWGRGGWYTPRWVDLLLFPANGGSADRVLAHLQDLRVGDLVPDGPPETECGFVVVDLRPAERLVLHSTSHLPISWRHRGIAGVDWTWVFTLEPVGENATRLGFRWRARTTPWWLTVAAHVFIVPADYLMSHGMLRGIRTRVVSGAHDRLSDNSVR
ncbi:MAG: SRPBCC family protein [Actinomycetales bacterium]|nr:SRPBCC family protein [Actinomycetales bacterium]